MSLSVVCVAVHSVPSNAHPQLADRSHSVSSVSRAPLCRSLPGVELALSRRGVLPPTPHHVDFQEESPRGVQVPLQG